MERKKHNITIQTDALSIGYKVKRRNKVVHPNINVSLRSGELTCLLGLNGAGKSTLLRTLCGFQPPLNGGVLLRGIGLESYSQSDLSKIIGVVLTEKTNAGGITVYELVSLGRHPYTGFFGQLKANDHKIIMSALEAVGIAHKSKNYVSELSDGERQKVMIAKVLAQQCDIIILDEPTAFLDVTSRIETMVLLRKLSREQEKSILLSTHDMDSAIQMGDCLWLQSGEKPITCGAPEDLILDGKFGEYFDKKDISFNPSTGKLETQNKLAPIGIDGDFLTSFWVGNAMVRNGFSPSAISDQYPHVHCNSKNDIELSLPNGRKYNFNNISDLCLLLA